MTIEALAQLPEEARQRVIEEAFGKVVATEEGQIVFSVMLEHLYFFRRAETPEHQALNNYGKFLLGCFGREAKYRVIEALVNPGGKHG